MPGAGGRARGRRWPIALAAATLGACAAVPQQAPPDPAQTAQAFAARQLADASPQLPPAAAGWDRAQWLSAALALNPDLAEARAQAAAVAAGERTAAQLPNPTLNLFGEYVAAAAGGSAWLYGLSLDFLLQRPGDRGRAKRSAALQTQAAQADLAESIWQIRSGLRNALLDAAYAQDQAALLQSLARSRAALLASARARLAAGDAAAGEVLRAQADLAAAHLRLLHAQQRGIEAQARLAAAVGVPASALEQVAPRWPGWSDIGALPAGPDQAWRQQALIARPALVRALREYDLAEVELQRQVARRWPELHVTPGYAWDRGGVHENQLNENLRDNELGLSLELPLFNRNEGPIGEALARRTLAGKHLLAVQADLFEQIDRAERAWPAARQGWQEAADAAALAVRQQAAAQRALAAGEADRSEALQAEAAAAEAQAAVQDAAYAAQAAFAALEDAYHRPLEGPECEIKPGTAAEDRS